MSYIYVESVTNDGWQKTPLKKINTSFKFRNNGRFTYRISGSVSHLFSNVANHQSEFVITISLLWLIMTLTIAYFVISVFDLYPTTMKSSNKF